MFEAITVTILLNYGVTQGTNQQPCVCVLRPDGSKGTADVVVVLVLGSPPWIRRGGS